MVFNNTVTGTTYSPRLIGLRTSGRSCHDEVHLSARPTAPTPSTATRFPPASGAGYPCMGQPGRATNLGGGRMFDPTPCYAWNNTLNGEKLLMGVTLNKDPNKRRTIKEGREFFNEKPPEEYYKPYIYPHPLQGGWDVRMKSAAGPSGADSSPPPCKTRSK